ncbi:MAG: hypothetical protein UV61_C0021G0008 [Candidatus Gottesmanbacteria bacterium GW2011_GWB1_43_11]|uniref:Uncharacterized protein n=1 Tax=Candidatus Gottesmanbacteria bacterium GW2011_GWB1_43_11 TaxID=1618446 RepID=A0A0G1CHY0_9BACT|nr:MAG: hypothetical protein UV17_C0023G0003 [Candidatus Gottesmanbacteria bacterium GW2011_GWA1_42_26]KKS80864.1 MAG: hypothetical protein UV55_C0027G0004 [Candidatus Gottesmanbacteria bacterium GW2011_GWC1_43_10]KKS85092.1 MAG: hypothetical protein UV61_C0021G0008 [Candidatus Gottesmanbacteria bacterium GW2011_GWB1_43_11]OGG07650.1 MAG: hypothetical protein A2699_06165 [Candidatus Gottesmanbacteria bacterium RIFCSPHIGHO2_01_FULL_43_15]HCM38287.1 hypothetical protein [Patescibacteria group bac
MVNPDSFARREASPNGKIVFRCPDCGWNKVVEISIGNPYSEAKLAEIQASHLRFQPDCQGNIVSTPAPKAASHN